MPPARTGRASSLAVDGSINASPASAACPTPPPAPGKGSPGARRRSEGKRPAPAPPRERRQSRANSSGRPRPQSYDFVGKRVIGPGMLAEKYRPQEVSSAAELLVDAKASLRRVQAALAEVKTQSVLSQDGVDNVLAEIIERRQRVAALNEKLGSTERVLKEEAAVHREEEEQALLKQTAPGPDEGRVWDMRLEIEDLRQASRKRQAASRQRTAQLNHELKQLTAEKQRSEGVRDELLAQYTTKMNDRKGGLFMDVAQKASLFSDGAGLCSHAERAMEVDEDMYEMRGCEGAGEGTAAYKAPAIHDDLEDAFLAYAPSAPQDVWAVGSRIREVTDIYTTLFPDSEVDAMLADARMMTARHAHGLPWSCTVPLFIFTKVWLKGCIAAEPRATPTEAEAPHMAVPRWTARVVDSGQQADVQAGRMITDRAQGVVQYRAHADEARSGWRDAVLWLPAPAHVFENKMKAVLPPPHVLEYMYSRSPTEVLTHATPSPTVPSSPMATERDRLPSGFRRLKSVVRGGKVGAEQAWDSQPLLDPEIDEAVAEAQRASNPHRACAATATMFRRIVDSESRRPVVPPVSLKLKYLRSAFEDLTATAEAEGRGTPTAVDSAPIVMGASALDSVERRSGAVTLSVEDIDGTPLEMSKVGAEVQIQLPAPKTAPTAGSFSSTSQQFFEYYDPRRRSNQASQTSANTAKSGPAEGHAKDKDVSLVLMIGQSQAAYGRALERLQQFMPRGTQLHAILCGRPASQPPSPMSPNNGSRRLSPHRPHMMHPEFIDIGSSRRDSGRPQRFSTASLEEPAWLGQSAITAGGMDAESTTIAMGGGVACTLARKLDLAEPAPLVASVMECLKARRSDGTHGFVPGVTPAPMTIFISVTEGSPRDCAQYKAAVEAELASFHKDLAACSVVCWRVEGVATSSTLTAATLSPTVVMPQRLGSLQRGSRVSLDPFIPARPRFERTGSASTADANVVVTVLWSGSTGVETSVIKIDTDGMGTDAESDFAFRGYLQLGMEDNGIATHDLQAVGVFYTHDRREAKRAGRSAGQPGCVGGDLGASMRSDAPAPDTAGAFEKRCAAQFRELVGGGSASAVPVFFVRGSGGPSVIPNSEDQRGPLTRQPSASIFSVEIPSSPGAKSTSAEQADPEPQTDAKSGQGSESGRRGGLSGRVTVVIFYRTKPVVTARLPREDLVLRLTAQREQGRESAPFVAERLLRVPYRHLLTSPYDKLAVPFCGRGGVLHAELGITPGGGGDVPKGYGDAVVSPWLLRALVGVGLGPQGLAGFDAATPAELADLFSFQLLHYGARVFVLSLSGTQKLVAENVKQPTVTVDGFELHPTSLPEMHGASCTACQQKIHDERFYYYLPEGDGGTKKPLCSLCSFTPYVMCLDRLTVPAKNQFTSLLLTSMAHCRKAPVVVIEGEGPLRLTNPQERNPLKLVFRNDETGFEWGPMDDQAPWVELSGRKRPKVTQVELNSWLAPMFAPFYAALVEALGRILPRTGTMFRKCPRMSVTLRPGTITMNQRLITSAGFGSHSGAFREDQSAGAEHVVLPVMSQTGRGIAAWSRFGRDDEVLFRKGCYFRCGERGGNASLEQLTPQTAMQIVIRGMLLTVQRPVDVMLLTEIDRALSAATGPYESVMLQFSSVGDRLTVSSGGVGQTPEPNSLMYVENSPSDCGSPGQSGERCEPLGEAGAALLADVLRLRANLSTISLRNQRIPWRGAARLLDAIRTNHNVRTVDISDDDESFTTRESLDIQSAIRLRLIFNSLLVAASKLPDRPKPVLAYNHIVAVCDESEEAAWPALFAIACHDVVGHLVLDLTVHPKAMLPVMIQNLTARLATFGAQSPELRR
eukprot:TRINITY_DN19705_c0_g1_i2.p1 TRINITY_DN19705_c0_g1~~TRINITY_DN19705_c0_g1_i2.p1  ORF type:complete len:1844 (+),score=286.89 TRINITY_DN19705_c0_g1_i2:117-5648(+)